MAADRPEHPSDPPSTESPDLEAIGPYRLLRLLGEGGMGLVYEAEQSEPIRRRVALKLVRGELASPQVTARFEAERQALAVMQHPNIAKVLDAGTAPDGRPYFVMDHVVGEPITEFCDTHRLSTRDRLGLFVQVCEAVQHAHQKGVIHRDLKPSNVLVTEEAGSAAPRVIDFGIAKAMGVQLTDRTLATHMGAVVGTPAYMSPEQAAGAGLDVDTRADIYSLGVLLYELLVGRLPVDPDDVGFVPFIAGLVAGTTNPPTPSQRLAQANGDAARVAAARRTELGRLRQELKGDLDWIVMRAIETERERRYETANALALDLGRYLADEPVRARPPSTAYRLRKFAKRNRAGVVAGAAAVVALVGGAVATTVGMVRATRAEDRALAAQAEAEREAETANQVSDFLGSLFQASDPSRGRERELTARELLDQGAARIGTELADRPLVQNRLMSVIARSYIYLGRVAEARALNEQRLATLEAALGPNHPEVARALISLAFTSPGYEASGQLYARALAVWESYPGPERDGGIAIASALLAGAYMGQGRLVEGEQAARRAIAILERYPEPQRERWEINDRTPDELHIAALLNLGASLGEEGRYGEALSIQERSLEVGERSLGPDHPDVARHLANLGENYHLHGRYAEAEPLLRRGLDIRERAVERRGGIWASLAIDLGAVMWRTGRHAEGDSLLGEAFELTGRPMVPYERGMLRLARGDALGAERMFRGFLESLELTADEEPPATHDLDLGLYWIGLGEALLMQGDLAGASSACGRAARLYEAWDIQRMDDRAARAWSCLAAVHAGRGESAEAERLFRRAMAVQHSHHTDQPEIVHWREELSATLEAYAALLRSLGRFQEAAKLEARLTEVRASARSTAL